MHSHYRHTTHNLIRSCDCECFTSRSVHENIFTRGRVYQSEHYCRAASSECNRSPLRVQTRFSWLSTTPQSSVTAGFWAPVVPPCLTCARAGPGLQRFPTKTAQLEHLRFQDGHGNTKHGLLSSSGSSEYGNFDFYGNIIQDLYYFTRRIYGLLIF